MSEDVKSKENVVESQVETDEALQRYIEEENRRIDIERKKVYDIAKDNIVKIKKDKNISKVGFINLIIPSTENNGAKFLYFKIYGISDVAEYKEKIAPIMQSIEDYTRYSDYDGKDIFELYIDLIKETYIPHELNISIDDIPVGSYVEIANRIANANGYGAVRHTNII